jgi:hypothetical protein
MALTTLAEMKSEILDNWEQFEDNPYGRDLLTQFADSAIPPYNNLIILEWQAMPSEFDNAWQDMGGNPKEGIVSLMTADLFNYYLHLAEMAYTEILEEKEELENA